MEDLKKDLIAIKKQMDKWDARPNEDLIAEMDENDVVFLYDKKTKQPKYMMPLDVFQDLLNYKNKE